MRKLPLALACALIFGSSSAFAIGLGELQTQSNLNQPLRAMIPITDVRPGDVDALSVKIGDEAQFARHGYSLMSIYGRIKLQIVGGQRPHILLTTDAPVRDPVVGLVLEVDGPSGTLERAVSILLDPEGYTPMAVAKPSSARASAREAFLDAQPSMPMAAAERAPTRRRAAPLQTVPMTDGGDYTAVSGDTAYGIAMRVKPDGVSLQQTIDTILHNNPQAFADPADAGTLLAGKTLTIPNAQVMRQQARPVAATAAKPRSSEAVPSVQAVASTDATQPRLDIVQPTIPATASAPAVVAPVVGEVVSGTAGTPATMPALNHQAVPQTPVIPAEIQETIEASKVENERLTGLLASQDQRLQKMEELLRLNEALIKDMEKKLNAAPAEPAVPVAAPVASAAPWWSYGLMGLAALLAAALAYVAGSRRRAKDEPATAVEQPVSTVVLEKNPEPTLVAPAVASPVAAPVAAAAVVAADVIEDRADPVKAALEEADVMQAYGLHDRAIQVLSDALQAQPGHAVLMARRARAMHEAGDADGFLREAQAFREQHPGDEAQWAELRALGATHYPTSPLFIAAAASGLGAATSPWASSSAAPVADADDASALIQPLEGLDLGAPAAALNELLNSQPMTQPSMDGSDMLPLDLDLPSISSLEKAADEGSYALDTTASGNISDFVDDWAPLELPVVNGDMQSAPQEPFNAESEVSADDLAVLGIEPSAEDAHPFAAASIGAQTATIEFIEPEFVEDMQSTALSEAETAALDLDFIPLPLAEAPQQDVAADEVTHSGLMMLDPVYDTSALSLELEEPPAAIESPAIEALELPLDLPLAAPIAGFQEVAPAPLPASGMMSDQEVKLDIAAAYMDMGDPLGAREMLEEILASDCDELLKDRANQMMARLSA